MNNKELVKLTQELVEAIKERKVNEALQKNPNIILPLRLSLGMSQKQFLRNMKNPFSQVSLINYENGRRKRMIRKNAALIFKQANNIKPHARVVIENYKKFNDMKKGKHMTKERGKELHRIWMEKTTRTQREKWGRLGASITNRNPKLTIQEKIIKKAIESNLSKEFVVEMHKEIEADHNRFNIDFVIYSKDKPLCFIESTARRHDLTILSQAYAYRKRVLSEKYPNTKFVMIADILPSFAKQILKNEFDIVSQTNNLENFLVLLKNLAPIHQT